MSGSSQATIWMWMVLDEEERVPMLSQKFVNDRNKFAVNVDVSQFKPEELKVNIDGRTVWIEGHHFEKKDRHGTIERSFKRSYLLSEDCKLENLQSHLSADGHLFGGTEDWSHRELETSRSGVTLRDTYRLHLWGRSISGLATVDQIP